MSNKKPSTNHDSKKEPHQQDLELIPNEQHPDYLSATVGEDPGEFVAFTPTPDGPLPPQLPLPKPLPTPLDPRPIPPITPNPPLIPGQPIRICSPVSGRYTHVGLKSPAPGPVPILPILNRFFITVRVDVDRFFPQDRISIEISQIFPRATAHVIAEVTSDQCLSLNRRRIAASITFREGDASLFPGDQLLFDASRGRGVGYESYTLTVSGAGIRSREYALSFQSQFFDSVEFEVDRVDNAGTAVTTYNTTAHPNRPSGLAAETLSLSTVYQRAGFEVSMSPNTSVIPTSDAGSNGTWSDAEMHNAMVTYWSRFANRPQWALWVLYAAQHDWGRSLGGIMFDDIGPQHRQGTAIFTNSFIQDVPAGETNPAAWRQRMVFWTAIHEMGHAFNLAHSWQKSMGAPWIPLADEPEARSFMNYPFSVQGGESRFFSDFRFRFSDDELIFMRHAPRSFVQMGNSNWFVNHGFEEPQALLQSGNWKFQIRPNRELNTYSFLEPVAMEFKLTNTSRVDGAVEDHLLADGGHVKIFIQRHGAVTRQWRPLVSRCHEVHLSRLRPGESIYGAHVISASTDGWLIDEPGFYKVQAAVEVGGEIVVSNVLRLYVSPPASNEENKLAPEYFTEEVARALVFGGTSGLPRASATLEEVVRRCPKNPAALHAQEALVTPKLRDFKVLEAGADSASLVIRSEKSEIDTAAREQKAVLTKDPDQAADTFGHIGYFGALEHLAEELVKAGDEQEAKSVLEKSVATMKKRHVLPAVVQATEKKISRIK